MPPPLHRPLPPWLPPLLLVLLTLLPYLQVWDFSFLNLDDDSYISKVPQLLQGWSLESWRWAWTTADPFLMPVVRLTFLTEVSLYGLHGGGFHLVNLLFHVANVLLLWHLWQQWRGDGVRAWLVAALFALHPQHVEAVAWVSERKEVMSAFFGLLALWSYTRYTRAPLGRPWYLTALACLLLSLLCKPMWVTLPVLLLLLDFWPLQRHKLGWPFLIREKLPFLALALMVSIVTLLTFHQGNHLTDLTTLPLGNRLSNMLLGYGGYLAKTLWPVHLGLPYRVDAQLPPWPTLVAHLLAGLTITMAVWQWRHRWPVLGVAWGWFLISLIPVSGILEGGQPLVMADRRSYVPHMLLLAALVWSIPLPPRQTWVALVWAGVLASMAWLTADYTRHWRDSTSLWRHFYEKGFEPDFARWALAQALAAEGHLDQAIDLAYQAHRSDPGEASYLRTLGDLLQRSGQVEKAWQVRRFILGTHSPTTPKTLRELGLQAFSEKRHEDVILLLGETWQRGQKNDPIIALLLGLSLSADGQSATAEQLWRDHLTGPEKIHRCGTMLATALQQRIQDRPMVGWLMTHCEVKRMLTP